MSNFPRARWGAAIVVAFFCGLVFASGFDLTRFSWARSSPTNVAVTMGSHTSMGSPADIQNGFVSVVARVKPAVVTIRVKKFAPERPVSTRRRQGNGGGGASGGGRGGAGGGGSDSNQLPPDMNNFLRQFGGGQAMPDPNPPDETLEGAGSGFIVSKDGYILTNNHVVAEADQVTVDLVDQREFDAKVIGRDPTTDVALIKIDATDLPTVTMGDDAKAQVGEWALAIGNPLDLDFTVTAGIVSAKGRNVQVSQPTGANYNISDFIQTDAAINPGNSGGPLVDANGEVIGINSMIESETGSYVGYGFAIPITLAEQVMNDLIKYGHVRRAIIGVSIGVVTPEDAQAAGLKTIGGAKVGLFSPDPDDAKSSPAGRAGIEKGDIIIAAAGKPVDRVSTLQRILRGFTPGQTVDVEVMRFGQDKTFRVTLGEQPSDSSAATVKPQPVSRTTTAPTESKSYDRVGLTVVPASSETPLFDNRQLPALPAVYQKGLLITDVSERGPNATKAPKFAIITKEVFPTARDIASKDDFDKALADVKPGGVITLSIAAVDRPTGTWVSELVTLRVR